MKIWDKGPGLWTLIDLPWLGLSGTTPRNADIWQIYFIVGPRKVGFDLTLSTGSHWGFSFECNWFGFEKWLSYRHKSTKCRCYQCGLDKLFADREAWAEISRVMNDPDRPVRKLPPRDA